MGLHVLASGRNGNSCYLWFDHFNNPVTIHHGFVDKIKSCGTLSKKTEKARWKGAKQQSRPDSNWTLHPDR